MGFLILLAVFFILAVLYIIYSSYFSQILINIKKKKDFVEKFKRNVRGSYIKRGYFATSHKIISAHEFKTFSNKEKLKYSSCYNIVKFKTEDANWELFFHLVKDSSVFSEILNVRVFPRHNHIRSVGNAERDYSRLNIFTNNQYLSKILESSKIFDDLNWLIKNNGDIILVNSNSIHFKAFIDSKDNVLNSKLALDMVHTINEIKTKVYKPGILEY